jgi:hypothetical protein
MKIVYGPESTTPEHLLPMYPFKTLEKEGRFQIQFLSHKHNQ